MAYAFSISWDSGKAIAVMAGDWDPDFPDQSGFEDDNGWRNKIFSPGYFGVCNWSIFGVGGGRLDTHMA